MILGTVFGVLLASCIIKSNEAPQWLVILTILVGVGCLSS